jgi:hypothetical protein
MEHSPKQITFQDIKPFLTDKKKIEVESCILTEHNGIKLELNNKRSYRHIQTHGNINTLLNDQRVIEIIRGRIKELLQYSEKNPTIYQKL